MVRPIYFLCPPSFLLVVLTGCGVPYSEVGSRGSGGHSTNPIGNNQFEVTYLSNQSGGQPSNRMRELTLLRAAEVTLEYGFSHFVVEDELEDVQTKWRMRPTTTPIGGIGSSGSGISTGGTVGGIGIGSPTGGLGTTSGAGVISSSTPVPVSIPELTLRIRCYHGVPTAAYQGELYDAARLRTILAVQYDIDIGRESKPARPPPTIQVIE